MSLLTIAREWTRLGCIGFGGPPTHIALLRRLCVEERGWIDEPTFADAIATTNLLPGPASTQLAIYCAWRLRGPTGALIGGFCFIVPGLILILMLSAVFLARRPPTAVLGIAAGAGAAVPAVAVSAAWGLARGSWTRLGPERNVRLRWCTYVLAGAVMAAMFGTYLALLLIACGVVEVMIERRSEAERDVHLRSLPPVALVHAGVIGGLGALIWVAFKVGALSYGGGFVIIPLMQHDAVSVYHWMSAAQFLNAVALGQITPGPVVQTVAVVGYAASGLRGGLVAAAVAFAPSFAFILLGGSQFHKIRSNFVVQAFFLGAGPAVIGAIAGAAIPLGLALGQLWQVSVLLGALAWFFLVRRGVVSGLLCSGAIGLLLAIAGIRV